MRAWSMAFACYVNIRYMFNGNRLTFIGGYKLKKDSKQGELPLDEALTAALPAP